MAGVKVSETPLGNPVIEKVTAALKPPADRDIQGEALVRSVGNGE